MILFFVFFRKFDGGDLANKSININRKPRRRAADCEHHQSNGWRKNNNPNQPTNGKDLRLMDLWGNLIELSGKEKSQI